MTISLLHPSRGRPKKAFDNMYEWLPRAGNVTFQHILSLDTSDPHIAEYLSLFDSKNVIIRNNSCVVEATNEAAKVATGDILIYLSDDFKCTNNWGELILKEFENENRPLLLKVHDCLQEFHARVATIPIMNRALYNKLGYFWNPLYKSMWVDCDLFETCHAIGAIKNARHLEFPHHHYSNPDDNIRAERDETYIRSEGNWQQGEQIFRQRKLQKFRI